MMIKIRAVAPHRISIIDKPARRLRLALREYRTTTQEPLIWTSFDNQQQDPDSNSAKMLSSSTNSSIQKRRQTHRRQQSLETPILAAPLPPNRYPRAQMHRRGISLDQPMTTLTSPIEFTRAGAPIQYTDRPNVSIPLEQERQQPHGTQHILQETQQQRPSQPGPIPMDFSAHLQQQLNGISLPAMNAAEAKQQLQNHINWFQATYGEANQSLTAVAPPEPFTFQPLSHAPLTPTQTAACLPMPQRQGQASTVPNTPHRHIARGRTPPQTEHRHSRSQSFQYDATPLTQSSGGDIFDPSSFGMSMSMYGDHQSYASSAYSSSIADPTSPSYSGTMPTVPEDDLLPMDEAMMSGSHHLLRATMAGSVSEDEFDDLHAPQPYSPRQAALLALGDINASIEETGISAHQVNQYMSEQNEHDQKWTCLYPECGKKFGRKENIRAHIQTHLGDRQFRCNDCGKCFVRQHDLKRHAKIHSGVKPNVCPCGMSFARQDALTRHRQRGTCFGVLPGFEKHDDERKKRGRPRKERPDFETRLDKASRARHMDAMAARQAMSTSGSVYHGSASSDSGASDHSSPLTPAPSSDIDDMLFNDFVSGSGAECATFNMPAQAAWMVDTPPTSPASYHTLPKTIAPVMLSNHASPAASSPASMDDCELALLAWRGDEHQQLVF